MPPAPLSGVDAISPAFGQAKRQLFQPFHFALWARLAVIAMMTGEFSGSCGGGNFSRLQTQRKGGEFLRFSSAGWERWPDYLPWIGLGVVALTVLALLWIYVDSVFRFVLFDAVLSGKCALRNGWRRWKSQGANYFRWQIGFGLATLAAFGAAIGLPIVAAVVGGVFREPDKHIALLVLGGLGLFLLLITLLVVSSLISLFAKDFVVPVMALENVRVLDGWRRLLPILRAAKRDCAGYVLMKIVLALGSAILFGVLIFFALLVLLVPLGLLGVGSYFLARAEGWTWNLATISACVVLGALALSLILYVVAFISAPAMVFFQSYTNHFLGSRYPALGAQLFPPPAGAPLADAAPSPAG